VAQRAARDPQPPGRARHVATAGGERRLDVPVGDRRGAGRRRVEHGPDVRGVHALAGMAQEQALHRAQKLAHVPRPGMPGQARERIRRERGLGEPEARGEVAQTLARQERHVGAPLAQRRKGETHHVEAVVEVGAEAAGRHLAPQVAARGGDDARVHDERARAAQPLEAPVLEHAQELRLEPRREVADLVEEDRAAAGQLEAARPTRRGAREGAALVAEELALHQRGGERGAVHVDEGAVPATGARVQRPRHEPLPRAGLAREQHRGVEGRHRPDLAAQLPHGGMPAQDLVRSRTVLGGHPPRERARAGRSKARARRSPSEGVESGRVRSSRRG